MPLVKVVKHQLLHAMIIIISQCKEIIRLLTNGNYMLLVSSSPFSRALCRVCLSIFQLLLFLESRKELCLCSVGAFLYNRQMFLTKHYVPQKIFSIRTFCECLLFENQL